MILVGERWHRLNLRDRFDVVEAVLAEDGQIDAVLDALEERISRAAADEETWGETQAAAEGMRIAERQYKQADPLTAEQRAERERRKAARRRSATPATRTGHPMEAAFMNMTMMAAARARRLADSQPMEPEAGTPAP